MLVKLKAPEGITDVSFGGVNYAVENGIVEVAETGGKGRCLNSR